MPEDVPRRFAFVLTALAFLLSGAAALVYQVSWQRILALPSGIGIYSIAMIVGAFMAGLGLGSALGGVLSVRLSRRRALEAFALLELGVGAFGMVSCHLFYDWLYLRGEWLYVTPLRTGVAHFLSLIVPTGLMGMSLPFLTRALVRDAPGAGRTIGYLYSINLLGAALGAVATPWLLVRYLGLPGATAVAAAFNVVAGLAALLAVRGQRGEETRVDDVQHERVAPAERRPFGLWLTLYGLSGFCALSLEILWFRIVDVIEKSTAFTFGTVLSVYLLGSALGSFASTRLLDRIRRPLRGFLLCQCLLLLYAGVAVFALVRLPPSTPGYRALFEQFLRPLHGPDENAFLLYAALPLLLFGLPTVLMGASFPILQRAVHDDAAGSGRRVGFLQASNILGCILGSFFVGLALLSWLGTSGTLGLLLGIGLVFAAVGLRFYGRSFLALGAALALMLLALPDQNALWQRLHGASRRSLVAEDATGVVLMKPVGSGWSMWVHGKRNSYLPYGGLHTALGAIPALVHPSPKDIAIIGLATGDTAWASGCREATERITVFEIVRPQFEVLGRLRERKDAYGKLQRLFEDGRYTMTVADGRNSIERSERLWDVIEMDALYPTAAGAGALYSVEFFSNLARKLKPGGIVCTWSPTPRTYASFARALPHLVDFGGGKILLGSNEPIPRDREAWRVRLLSPAVRAYLGSRSVEVMSAFLDSPAPGKPPARRDLNLDLFPRDEFATPR